MNVFTGVRVQEATQLTETKENKVSQLSFRLTRLDLLKRKIFYVGLLGV